jgi:hypothetical protein
LPDVRNNQSVILKMDEHEYQEVYTSIAPAPCLFEKSILALKLTCVQSSRKNIAEREVVTCLSNACRARCDAWLYLIREKSQFALHLGDTTEPLPHAKELKVQVGGIRGLDLVLGQSSIDMNLGVSEILEAAVERFDRLEAVPFTQVVQAVAQFKGRK